MYAWIWCLAHKRILKCTAVEPSHHPLVGLHKTLETLNNERAGTPFIGHISLTPSKEELGRVQLRPRSREKRCVSMSIIKGGA